MKTMKKAAAEAKPAPAMKKATAMKSAMKSARKKSPTPPPSPKSPKTPTMKKRTAMKSSAMKSKMKAKSAPNSPIFAAFEETFPMLSGVEEAAPAGMTPTKALTATTSVVAILVAWFYFFFFQPQTAQELMEQGAAMISDMF